MIEGTETAPVRLVGAESLAAAAVVTTKLTMVMKKMNKNIKSRLSGRGNADDDYDECTESTFSSIMMRATCLPAWRGVSSPTTVTAFKQTRARLNISSITCRAALHPRR